MKLSPDLKTTLTNIATHEDRGTHATAVNPLIKTLERRGLVELKPRSPDDPDWLLRPYRGWGLTLEGRAILGRAWN